MTRRLVYLSWAGPELNVGDRAGRQAPHEKVGDRHREETQPGPESVVLVQMSDTLPHSMPGLCSGRAGEAIYTAAN